jgi:outer membrane protein
MSSGKIKAALPLLAAAFLLLAFGAPAAAQIKIAVVDVNRVVNECKAGVRAQAEIKQRLERLQAEVGKMSEEFQRLQQDFQKQEAVLTPEARSVKERELGEKYNLLNQRQAQAQQEMAEAERKALLPIMENLRTELKNLGGRENYAAILDTRTLPYFDPKLDITNKVLGIYDKAHP